MKAVVLLVAMWLLSMVLGFREYRRASDKVAGELNIWLEIGLDLVIKFQALEDGQTDTPILWVGRGWKLTLGYEPSEMVGHFWSEFVHPDDLDATVKIVDATVPVMQHVNRWRHKKDLPGGLPRWVWLEWNVMPSPLHDNMVFASARDNTSRFEREAQMATWSRITSDLLAVGDTAVPAAVRKFEWVNEAWARQLGWSSQELYALPITAFIAPPDVDSTLTSLRVREEAGITESQTEVRVRVKPQEGNQQIYRWYEWLSVQLNGKIYASGRDITENKVHRDEMSAAIRSLKASNADLERFASVAAHQLRSPPRTIAGIAAALEEDYGHLLDAEGLQFLTDIRQDADQMAEIVNGLFRFSQVRTMEGTPVGPVDLNDLMEEIFKGKQKRRELEEHMSLVWDVLPIVLGDKVLIQEALTNLIDNGFKFNQSEEMTVGVLAHQRSDGRWEITVEDNGIGVDPRYQHKLFQMFERVHPTYKGTGVGLALVAAIVEKLGGSIRIDSGVGLGSAFTFDLPNYVVLAKSSEQH